MPGPAALVLEEELALHRRAVVAVPARTDAPALQRAVACQPVGTGQHQVGYGKGGQRTPLRREGTPEDVAETVLLPAASKALAV